MDDVPNFKDVNPRLGVVHNDVFGNGKTAIKGAWGRYVGGLGIDFADALHPELSLVQSTTRNWNDQTFGVAYREKAGNSARISISPTSRRTASAAR